MKTSNKKLSKINDIAQKPLKIINIIMCIDKYNAFQ